MSVSTTMAVATTTVPTLMEVMFAPALVATSLTVMDIHVKVGIGNFPSITWPFLRGPSDIFYHYCPQKSIICPVAERLIKHMIQLSAGNSILSFKCCCGKSTGSF